MSSFKDVVGHKNIIKYIESAVQADAVSHAYILNGERGSGKKLLANLFAMSLQCQDRDENGEACGKCQSCKQALHGNQPDIIRVSHEKPTTISVDDIRQQVNNDIVIKPYSSKYKIYIIPEADLMSVQAQNALLKTIEEPPEYAVIMLLTENAEVLLPTIRSRCVMMKLRNIKDQLVKKYLMEQMGREPTVEELATSLGTEKEELVQAMEAATEVESIYRPIHQEGDSQLSILDRLEEKSRPEEHLLNRMMLSQILDGLDKEERQLIYLRYFQEKTQAAVGEILGISQVQVSRMEKKILERMRKQM